MIAISFIVNYLAKEKTAAAVTLVDFIALKRRYSQSHLLKMVVRYLYERVDRLNLWNLPDLLL